MSFTQLKTESTRPTRTRGQLWRPSAMQRRSGSQEPHQPLLVDVMNRKQRLVFRALATAWFFSLLVFYQWWFQGEHVDGVIRFAVNSLLLTWTLALPAYFFFFVDRMKRSNPSLTPAEGWRVAMIATRAPSEPFAVVQKTLRAMLAQQYPHDTWLADEAPTTEIEQWCRRHEVKLCTRQNAPEYHREAWPRREKCKEGNLCYFYDHFGYRDYDYVVQLDADHVPTPGYLEEMIKPFADPAVGYVSAPSICSTNATSSWSARGRLFSEAMLHGPLQAGYTGGFAPLCIGSHYAVRTAALKQIGGLGPELAEDHSTTLMMNGHGWRGVHAIDAIAHGEGPPTLADCITQEFQWSRSLVVLMFTLLPKYWSRLPWSLRWQFLFCQLWYPLFGVSMLCGVALPVIAVLSHEPFVKVGYLDFLAHGLPVMGMSLLVIAYLKRYAWLRPADAPLLSWETALFQVARWPWALYGSIMGVVMAFRPRTVVFRVTPKGGTHPLSLDWTILLPYIAIVGISFLPAGLMRDAGEANGYFFFLILAQVVYLCALFSIVWIHRHEVAKHHR